MRTNLTIAGSDDTPYLAARGTAADSVTIDLATPAVAGEREAARQTAARHVRRIAATGRGVHVRVSDTRSGELEADLAAVSGPALEAVLLSGAEIAQDVRDADVAIRKQEMRRNVEPGTVRLIPEVDSATGLADLPRMLSAVDRHEAVALNAGALARDLGLRDTHPSLLEHAMAGVALAARTAGLPWLLADGRSRPGARSELATLAQRLGAAGAYVVSEAEVRGFSELFTPSQHEVEAAQRAIEQWQRIRRAGRWTGVANGELVDRRTVSQARALVELDEAIRRRERAT